MKAFRRLICKWLGIDERVNEIVSARLAEVSEEAKLKRRRDEFKARVKSIR
jgi:hypothetical protein